MVGRTKEGCPQGSLPLTLTHSHTYRALSRTQISTVANAHIDTHIFTQVQSDRVRLV